LLHFKTITSKMQNKLYYWLFLTCLLLVPVSSEAKIDAKNAPPSLWESAVSAQGMPHFPMAHPLDRFRMFKKWKNGLNTDLSSGTHEGGQKRAKKSKSALASRIFTAIALVIAGVLLVYWLQGTIALLLATFGIVSYFRNRDRVAAWQRRREERRNKPYVAEERKDEKGNPIKSSAGTDSLNHPANTWIRRGITRFIIGIGLVFSAIIVGIVGAIFGAGTAIGIFGLGLIIFGVLFTAVGVGNAIKSLAEKEPQSGWSWLVIVLGIPLVLALSLLLLLISTV
jgi:hypothetical protein